MTDNIVHFPIPSVPEFVWKRLALDAEEKPMAAMVIGYVEHTQTLVVGRCDQGRVASWATQRPVPPDELLIELKMIREASDLPDDAVQFRNFEYVESGTLN